MAFLLFKFESHIAPLTRQTLHVRFGLFSKFHLVTAHLFFSAFFSENMLSNLAQTFSGVFIT